MAVLASASALLCHAEAFQNDVKPPKAFFRPGRLLLPFDLGSRQVPISSFVGVRGATDSIFRPASNLTLRQLNIGVIRFIHLMVDQALRRRVERFLNGEPMAPEGSRQRGDPKIDRKVRGSRYKTRS
jgi:hypothetical protein